jgi:TnpA family transposase
MEVEKNYVDSHGQSEVAFAFCRLLGFQLLPRLKAIHAQKLYRAEAGTVAIPKSGGGERKLGIPTVSDRIAQMVVKMNLEPQVEPLFHNDSYGYRPGKSAHDAVGESA